MKCVVSITASSVLAFVAFAADPPKEDATKDDVKKLQGTWQVIKWVNDCEKPAPAEELKGFTFEFKGDKVSLRSDMDPIAKPAKYTLKATKNPKFFDFQMEGTNPLPPLAPGIYKLDGDELSICLVAVTESDKASIRPTEFKPSKNNVLFVLKRVKKK